MNVVINAIPYFLAIFICTLLLNLCYAKLSKKIFVFNGKNIIIIILSSLFTLLNNIHNFMLIKAILNIFITCCTYKLIFKDNLKKTVVIFIINYSITIVFELIYTNLISVTNLFQLSAEFLNYTKIALSIITSFTFYILILIPFIRKKLSKLVDIIFSITNMMNILYLLLVTFIILGIFNVYNYEENGSFTILISIIILFAILFVLLISSIINSHMLKSSNQLLIKYNEKYGKFLDDYKIYKHNINNKLSAMKAYGNKKINSLIDDLLEEETTFVVKNNNLYNIPNGIKGIIAEKLYNVEYNVIINNAIKGDPFLHLKPRSFNSITECVGIALDNALEASAETDEPIIIVDIYENSNDLFIKIGNNFCNDMDIEKLGDKYYSTKNRGSGLGLFSLIQNKNVKEKILIINNFYYIELKIKKHAN